VLPEAWSTKDTAAIVSSGVTVIAALERVLEKDKLGKFFWIVVTKACDIKKPPGS
jgi:hypothetical protein